MADLVSKKPRRAVAAHARGGGVIEVRDALSGDPLFDLVLTPAEQRRALSAWTPGDAQGELAVVGDTLQARALAGGYDTISAADVARKIELAREACRALVAVHDETWKTTSRGDPLEAGGRGKALAAALRAGFKVSDFARGIIGMRLDPWEERIQHRDFSCVARQLDRWLELYEGGSPLGKRAVRTRTGRTVSVPQDYVWDEKDEHAAASGWSFDFAGRRWRNDAA